jgi:hypothetical protein
MRERLKGYKKVIRVTITTIAAPFTRSTVMESGISIWQLSVKTKGGIYGCSGKKAL